MSIISNNKLIFLAINIILGSILLYSYYHYIRKGGVDQQVLWGNMYPYRNYIMVSMLIAAIGYILVVAYSVCCVDSNNKHLKELMVAQIIIIVISMIWLPLTIGYAKSKTKHPFLALGIILTLFVVAMASLQQVISVYNFRPKTKNKMNNVAHKVALAGAILFCVHTGIIDFIGWNTGFFIK